MTEGSGSVEQEGESKGATSLSLVPLSLYLEGHVHHGRECRGNITCRSTG